MPIFSATQNLIEQTSALTLQLPAPISPEEARFRERVADLTSTEPGPAAELRRRAAYRAISGAIGPEGCCEGSLAEYLFVNGSRYRVPAATAYATAIATDLINAHVATGRGEWVEAERGPGVYSDPGRAARADIQAQLNFIGDEFIRPIVRQMQGQTEDRQRHRLLSRVHGNYDADGFDR